MKTTINAEIRSLYARARREKPFMLTGSDAACSLSAARTIAAFRALEKEGKVRLRAEPETENYFGVYGEPEPYERNGHLISQKEATAEYERILELHGVWWSCSEWFDGDE